METLGVLQWRDIKIAMFALVVVEADGFSKTGAKIWIGTGLEQRRNQLIILAPGQSSLGDHGIE